MGVGREVELRRLLRAVERETVPVDQAVRALLADHGEGAVHALRELLISRRRMELAAEVERALEDCLSRDREAEIISHPRFLSEGEPT